MDAVPERALGRALQADVDRQAQRLAGRRAASRTRPRPSAARASRPSAGPCRPSRAGTCRTSTRRPPGRSRRSPGDPSASVPCTARARSARRTRAPGRRATGSGSSAGSCCASARPGTAPSAPRGSRSGRVCRPRCTTTGDSGSLPCSFNCASMSLTDAPVTSERRRSSVRRAAQVFGRSAGHSSTRVPATFPTSTWPFRSRIGPTRGFEANRPDAVVVRHREVPIAREHLQRPEAQEEHREDRRARGSRAPRPAAPSAASADRAPRPSGRRAGTAAPAERARAASQGAAPRGCGRRSAAAGRASGSSAYTGSVRSRLMSEPERKRADHLAGRRRLAEHELQEELAEGVEARDDGDRDVGGVKAIARGRLAVAADPEPGDRHQQRGHAQRAERRRVEEQSGPEARERRRRSSRAGARSRAGRR